MADPVATAKKAYREAKAALAQAEERARQISDQRLQVETNIASAEDALRQARAAYDDVLARVAMQSAGSTELTDARASVRTAEERLQAQQDVLAKLTEQEAALALATLREAVTKARHDALIALREAHLAKVAEVGDELLAAALAQARAAGIHPGDPKTLIGTTAVAAIGQTWGADFQARVNRASKRLEAELEG